MKQVRLEWLETKKVPIDSLEDFQGQLKNLTKDRYNQFKKVLIKDGFTEPVSVWKNPKGKHKLLNGHQRLRTLKMMRDEGYVVPKDIPANFIEAKDEKEAKRKLLSLASQYGEVTEDGLYEFATEAELTFQDLKDNFNFPEINFDKYEKMFETDPQKDATEDEVPELPKDPISKLGDLYELGPHRLLCGDSTDKATVERLMNGEKAELCFTSPPYADQREYNGGKELSTEHLSKFIMPEAASYFAVNLGYSRKDGEVNTYWDDYIKAARDNGLKLLSWNIWNRSGFGYTVGQATAMFTIDHEWIFVFGKKAKELSRTIENKQAAISKKSTIRDADGSTRPTFGTVGSHRQLGTVFTSDIARYVGDDHHKHPAMFPVILPESYIQAITEKNNGVYEPFGGSGSTLIACEKTKRKCFMMELDPHYIDVIVSRWCKYTNQTKIKKNGKIVEWSV